MRYFALVFVGREEEHRAPFACIFGRDFVETKDGRRDCFAYKWNPWRNLKHNTSTSERVPDREEECSRKVARQGCPVRHNQRRLCWTYFGGTLVAPREVENFGTQFDVKGDIVLIENGRRIFLLEASSKKTIKDRIDALCMALRL